MRVSFTDSFRRDYRLLPKDIQIRLEKQLSLLITNIQHPSMRIKKMRGHRNIWEGRITLNYRFTFLFEGGNCILRRVGSHSILESP